MEKHIKAKICKDLVKRGFTPVLQIRTNFNGIADILVLTGSGNCFFIETKDTNGVESKLQQYRKEEFIKKGYNRYVLYSYFDYLKIYEK